MTNKEKISEYIYNNLNYIYCDNCRYWGGDDCEYCHRKSMGWEISQEYSEEIANDIINILGEDK